MLGTIWEQSIKTALMGLLFLMLCEVTPSFKAIGESASFSWPCRPQRERVELERLSSPEHHNKIHKQEDDPYILR